MEIKKPFFLTLLIVLLGLTIFISSSLSKVLITSFILALLLNPFYLTLKKIIKNETISALLVEITFYSIIIIILIFTFSGIANQVMRFSSPYLSNIILNIQNNTLNEFNITDENNYSLKLDNPLTKTTIFTLSNKLFEIILKTPSIIVDSFTIFFLVYLFLIELPNLSKVFMKILPRSSKFLIKKLLKKINILIKNIFYGYFMTGFIIANLTFVFLKILNNNYPTDFALLSGLFSLIPVIGTWIIPLFLIVYYFLHQNYLFMILLLLFAYFSEKLVRIIRIVITQDKLKIHPILFILGVIIGSYSFGIIGFLIGPILFGIIQITFKELIRNV